MEGAGEGWLCLPWQRALPQPNSHTAASLLASCGLWVLIECGAFSDFSTRTPPEPNSGVIEALPLLRPELSLSVPFSWPGEKEVPCDY